MAMARAIHSAVGRMSSLAMGTSIRAVRINAARVGLLPTRRHGNSPKFEQLGEGTSMKRKLSAAFTLVELLVVIGIIAVLISILIPALTRARMAAISVQCMSNLKQCGQAALLYAHNFHGAYPPSQGAEPNGGNNTIEKFIDYNDGSANRYIVGRLMAQYAGYKVPDYDGTLTWAANVANGYASPKTPIFYCPADDQSVRAGEPPFPEDNFLFYNNPSGNDNGKMRYWYVANPWHWENTAAKTTIAGSPYFGNEDMVAARVFAHIDIEPERNPRYFGPNPDPSTPWFNASKPCKAGLDYLRKVTDKRASEITIMACRSKAANPSVT